MTPWIELTENELTYGWESIQPTRRHPRPAHRILADEIWRLRDVVIDRRADLGDPYSLEASVLHQVIRYMELAAVASEQEQTERAVNHLLDAQAIFPDDDGLADALEVLTNKIAGHPLECGCVLPDQSCPVCRAAFWEADHE